MNTAQLLMQLSDAIGVAGQEAQAMQAGQAALQGLGEMRHTPLGSLICTLKQPKEGGIHMMLDAHMDEIGLVVTAMDEGGFLKVAARGGIDRSLLLASQVRVHTRTGILDGVICSVPPHLSQGEKKLPKVEEIYIDIGYTRERARELVREGDLVTLHSAARELIGGVVTGKALDNRAGCAAVILAARELAQNLPDIGISVVLSTMEEVGGMGAGTAANALSPTHAIAVDVSFALTPDAPKEKCGKLHEGPMIGIAPVLSAPLSDELIRLAKRDEIPYQLEVMGGKTGTNADSIAVSGAGVRTALLSVPQRYMHSIVECVSVRDVENTAKLIAALTREIGGMHA